MLRSNPRNALRRTFLSCRGPSLHIHCIAIGSGRRNVGSSHSNIIIISSSRRNIGHNRSNLIRNRSNRSSINDKSEVQCALEQTRFVARDRTCKFIERMQPTLSPYPPAQPSPAQRSPAQPSGAVG